MTWNRNRIRTRHNAYADENNIPNSSGVAVAAPLNAAASYSSWDMVNNGTAEGNLMPTIVENLDITDAEFLEYYKINYLHKKVHHSFFAS